MSKKIVVKLGGSMISKSDDIMIDFDYLKKFRTVLEGLINKGYQIFIVTGGGYMARKLINLAENYGVKTEDLHWIGTTYNNVNAEIVRSFLSDISNSRIISYETYYNKEEIKFIKSIIVGGGGRAGHSGDVDAILAAKKINSNVVFSLKNIDGVYTDDPKKNKNAKRILELSWQEYMEIIGNPKEHEPGGNYPVDPVASRMASENGIQFVVLSGNDLDSFKNAVIGKNFHGSTIK